MHRAPRGRCTPKVRAIQYPSTRKRRHTSSLRLTGESSCGTRMLKLDCRNAGTKDRYSRARQHEAVLSSPIQLADIKLLTEFALVAFYPEVVRLA